MHLNRFPLLMCTSCEQNGLLKARGLHYRTTLRKPMSSIVALAVIQ